MHEQKSGAARGEPGIGEYATCHTQGQLQSNNRSGERGHDHAAGSERTKVSLQERLLVDGNTRQSAPLIYPQTVDRASPAQPSTAASSSSSGLPAGDAPLSHTVWLMFGLLSVVMILAESSRGIVIPTLSLYQASLGGSSAFLGSLVAIFSVGRLASSYVFGRYLSMASKAAAQTPSPTFANNQSLIAGMLVSLVVVVAGHIAYIFAGSAGLSMLLLARLLVGFGTGTLVLARTFVGDQIPVSRKARFMAWLGIEQFVGFAFTPALGSIAIDGYIGSLHFTRFNFGSYLLAILTALAGAGLYAVKRHWWMREEQRQRDLERMLADSGADADPLASVFRHIDAVPLDANPVSPYLSAPEAPPPDMRPFSRGASESASPRASSAIPVIGPDNKMLWILVAGNFAVRGSLSVAETFGALIFYNVITGPSDADRVTDSSVFFLCLGIGGVVVFLLVERLVKWLTPRWALLFGALVGVIGYSTMMDWDADLGAHHFVFGMVLIWSISSPIVQTVIASQLSVELADRHRRVQVAAEAAARVQGGPPPSLVSPPSQALWMGHLTAAGSVGRILFPLLGGAVYSDRATGGVMLLCVLVHLLVFGAFALAHQAQLLRDLRTNGAIALVRLGCPELAFRLHQTSELERSAHVQLRGANREEEKQIDSLSDGHAALGDRNPFHSGHATLFAANTVDVELVWHR